MSIIRNGFQSADLDVPVVLPTLNLDFANSQSLDERITFTRGSIGTFVNKNGLIETAPANTPRFDYDPVTGECRGLLIEESRQNLLTYSDDFGDASWSKGEISIFTNSSTSPDGTTNADILTPSTANAQHQTYKTVSGLSDNTIYTSSIFIKKFGNQFSWCRLTLRSKNGTFTGVYFNVDTKQFGTSIGDALLVSYGYIQYPNGWIRLYITTNTSTGATTPNYLFYIANGNGVLNYSYSNSQTDGFYLWGAQVEAGAFPTSYIPTSGSTVTRSADLASMTGTNFSSWYNQTEGTLYANAVSNANTLNNQITGVAALNDGGGSYRVDLRYHQNGNSQTFFNGIGGGGTSLPRTSGFSLTNPKFIVSYQTKYINFAVNASLISSNTSRFVPYSGINTLRIGTFDSGNNYYLNGTIRKIAYYPKALSPAQLQYLTQ